MRFGALSAAALLLWGCSTPGPLHLYSAAPKAEAIHDVAIANDTTQDTPAFVGEGEQIVAFAYDPFTDHFFLRLAPGDRMRVVDRPARKIKREFAIEGARAHDGEMAIRPRDGHVLLIDGAAPELLEITRLGAFVRRVTLAGMSAAPLAVAIDLKSENIFALDSTGRTVRRFTAAGCAIGGFDLQRPAAAGLAYDSDGGEFYAPLAGEPETVGVFGSDGKLARTLPLARGDSYVDVGPHSFLRVF